MPESSNKNFINSNNQPLLKVLNRILIIITVYKKIIKG
jgi:hypothetical protein